MTQVKHETRGAGFYIVSEANGSKSRDQVTLGEIAPDTVDGENAILKVGTILGKRYINTTPTVSSVTGTGNGTITLAGTPLGKKAQVGAYKLQVINAISDSGVFSVTAPDGTQLPNLIVGTAYAGDHINLTVADGSSNWALGTNFTVTVAELSAGNQVYAPVDPDALDGTQRADAILFNQTNVSAGDVNTTVTSRDAEVLGSELVYPVGATDDEKAAFNANLLAKGIVIRN